MSDRVNNIDLQALKANEQKSLKQNGHFEVEKHIDGVFNIEGSPMFTAGLMSERAKFIMGADEPGVLGGMGVHATPLNYLMFGVMSCFASTVAIQAAKKGVVLKELKIRGHLYYDIGPVLTNSEFPIIKSLKLDVESDRDIEEILKISRKVCPALYAIANPIPTEISQVKPSK